jgi:hypothetical protein
LPATLAHLTASQAPEGYDRSAWRLTVAYSAWKRESPKFP